MRVRLSAVCGKMGGRDGWKWSVIGEARLSE